MAASWLKRITPGEFFHLERGLNLGKKLKAHLNEGSSSCHSIVRYTGSSNPKTLQASFTCLGS